MLQISWSLQKFKNLLICSSNPDSFYLTEYIFNWVLLVGSFLKKSFKPSNSLLKKNSIFPSQFFVDFFSSISKCNFFGGNKKCKKHFDKFLVIISYTTLTVSLKILKIQILLYPRNIKLLLVNKGETFSLKPSISAK